MKIWILYYTPNVYGGSANMQAWWSKKPDAAALLKQTNEAPALIDQLVAHGHVTDVHGNYYNLEESEEANP